jgi:methionyl-tRNA formyltransferase
MKIVLIGTDTPHRRFFINSLMENGVNVAACIFEKGGLAPNFEVQSDYYEEESDFLMSKFDGYQEINDIKVTYVDTLNSSDVIALLGNLNPDICFSSGSGYLNSDIRQFIGDKIINIHLGNAKEYRGLDTNLWAIYHSDYENLAVTFHRIDGNLDTGAIASIIQVEVDVNTSLAELRYLETMVMVKGALSIINDASKGKLKFREQEGKGRYYSFMPAVIKNYIYDRNNSKVIR